MINEISLVKSESDAVKHIKLELKIFGKVSAYTISPSLKVIKDKKMFCVSAFINYTYSCPLNVIKMSPLVSNNLLI